MADDETPPENEPHDAVWRWRFHQARQAGLNVIDSHLYADSDAEARILDQLVQLDCPPELIADIVL